MADAPWYELLDQMIENAEEGHLRYNTDIDNDDHPLRREANLTMRDAGIGIETLRKADLIDVDHDRGEFTLSPQGFEIALNHDSWRQRTRLNRLLVLLTGLLAASAVLGLLPTTWTLHPTIDLLVAVIAGGVMFVILIPLAYLLVAELRKLRSPRTQYKVTRAE